VRARIDEIGNPLAALVVTHAHPDHYGGVVEVIRGLDAPIVATAGVDEAIRSIDAGREEILRPMFGDEWPTERVFPTRRGVDGEVLGFGDIEFWVQDLGPGESLHDSVWLLDGNHSDVFTGDQGYSRMHSFLADAHWDQWLTTLERLRRGFPSEAVLHVGHGGPAGLDVLDWQPTYIENEYEFEITDGTKLLADCSRLIVSHFMTQPARSL
jgi:glyoxylase-like metal-dependent hydrolase (beta-lactamase superfamily II)